VRQDPRGEGMTSLVLKGGSFKGCPKRVLASAAAASKAKEKPKRKLWSKDKNGRFRTHGHNSVATARGTNWLTEDTCAGTRTRVRDSPIGRYELRGIPGGRYRVRAFLAPALALVTPDVRFLPDGQEHTFDLAMTDQRGVVARAAVAPDPPYLDGDVNLAIVVATRSVDPDGVVRSVPVSGVRVELDGLGAWSLRTPDSPRGPLQPRATTTTTSFSPLSTIAFTDANGQVRYELTCEQAGPPGLSLLVSVTVTPPAVEGEPPPVPEQRLESIPLTVPDCVDPTLVTEPPSAGDTVEDGDEGDPDGAE